MSVGPAWVKLWLSCCSWGRNWTNTWNQDHPLTSKVNTLTSENGPIYLLGPGDGTEHHTHAREGPTGAFWGTHMEAGPPGQGGSHTQLFYVGSGAGALTNEPSSQAPLNLFSIFGKIFQWAWHSLMLAKQMGLSLCLQISAHTVGALTGAWPHAYKQLLSQSESLQDQSLGPHSQDPFSWRLYPRWEDN